MKIIISFIHSKRYVTKALFLLFLASISSCIQGPFKPMSEWVKDNTAGINGSFEVVQSGLPVNWLFYTPNTVPEGDFEITTDTTEFTHGKQSVKFLVRECSGIGGWYSPGFCNEFEVKMGETYLISFWIKNEGCDFLILLKGLSSRESGHNTIGVLKESPGTWQQYEYRYTIPENIHRIRFEMNILSPGIFWIDDIRIDRQ